MFEFFYVAEPTGPESNLYTATYGTDSAQSDSRNRACEILKQSVLGRFVDREVIYCVSSLIYDLRNKDDRGGEYEEEIYDVSLTRQYTHLFEYECEKCEELWERNDEEPRTEELDDPSDCDADEDRSCPKCGEYKKPHTVTSEETDGMEAYEHWIVSDWFARKLRDHGEMVATIHGLTVWGRTTTGQSIQLDGIIERVWVDLHADELPTPKSGEAA